MNTWLMIFLFMSLIMNFLLLRAYLNRESEVAEILKMRDELERAKISLEKTLAKNAKSTRRTFLAGRFGRK